MVGEWNEENWFDLADYADVDMDAGFDYEPSDDSSDGTVASGDLPTDPGDSAAGGVEEGSLSPTTVRPREGSTLSKDKGQFDQNHTQVDSQHNESFSSKCPNPLEAVRLDKASSGSHNSGTSPASGDHLSLDDIRDSGIKHAFPANSTISPQITSADGDGYNLDFPYLEGITPSHQMVWKSYFLQNAGRQIHQPAQALQTIPLSWPFATWGLNILGPFPKAPGGFEFLFVAIDTFTKWIEAEPMTGITTKAAKRFMMRCVITRFGVPSRIITDNGKQFSSAKFQKFCDELGTRLCYASVAHPQSNGAVERANSQIMRGIKTRVFDQLIKRSGAWVQELPSVLWAIRTTTSRATGETPFFLVFGAEAMLPPELKIRSTRVETFTDSNQEQLRADDINLLEERRNQALIRSAVYQQALRRYYDRKVQPRSLAVGDLVLRLCQSKSNRNKLSPKWEGPYTVVEVTRPGSVRLAMEDGQVLLNSWNIDQLRKFYV
uniref:Putative retrotransposon protein n=1 Tax=Phyllostachys edulis TaxID=38705 RepID=D3IVU6_PHYED|nr:putative retrotransposon protein [Phyllostachys edulis]